MCFLDADVEPSPAEDVMAAQQKPKPTHAIEELPPPPPPSPQSSTPQATAPPSPPQQTTEKVHRSGGKVLAAPAVRKIAMEHNVRRIIHRSYEKRLVFFSNSLAVFSYFSWSCRGTETLVSVILSCPFI